MFNYTTTTQYITICSLIFLLLSSMYGSELEPDKNYRQGSIGLIKESLGGRNPLKGYSIIYILMYSCFINDYQ